MSNLKEDLLFYIEDTKLIECAQILYVELRWLGGDEGYEDDEQGVLVKCLLKKNYSKDALNIFLSKTDITDGEEYHSYDNEPTKLIAGNIRGTVWMKDGSWVSIGGDYSGTDSYIITIHKSPEIPDYLL